MLNHARPGTDDPSEPTWLGLRGLSRELIATAVPTPTAAPLRLLRPRARGSMRRELHEPFMPDGSRTRNKENHGSITFIIHRVIHRATCRVTPRNHEGPCFQARIAAEIWLREVRLWRTDRIEMGIRMPIVRLNGCLIVGIEQCVPQGQGGRVTTVFHDRRAPRERRLCRAIASRWRVLRSMLRPHSHTSISDRRQRWERLGLWRDRLGCSR